MSGPWSICRTNAHLHHHRRKVRPALLLDIKYFPIFVLPIRHEKTSNLLDPRIAFCLNRQTDRTLWAVLLCFMENTEVWKPIAGYEGLYEVSNFGNVKSLSYHRTKVERILRLSTAAGYPLIHLYKCGKSTAIKIHRLVATAFIPNPDSKPTVNHINGIKTDNRVQNLEWATYSENLKEAHRLGLANSKGERHSQSKLTSFEIIEIRTMGKSKTIYELGVQFGVSYQHISKIIRRETWRHI